MHFKHSSISICLFAGLITSFVVDPSQYWLTAGTCNGELVCWDMRFQLPVGRLTHPRGTISYHNPHTRISVVRVTVICVSSSTV